MSSASSEELSKVSPEYLAEDISQPLLALSIALIPLLTIFFALFLTSRFLLHSIRKVEAWLFMPLGYLSCLASCICGILFVKIGGSGRHTAYYLIKDPSVIEQNLRMEVAQEYLTFSSITFPKLAIVALYLNIFNEKWSRRMTWALGAWIVLTGIQYLILISSICEPFAFKWNKTIPGGFCHSTMARYKYGTLPNTLSDAFILVLPIPTLYKLQISILKKVGVSVIFLVAGCGIITAIIKTVTFFTVDLTTDVTYLSTRVEIWVLVEFCSYFMCACMPGAQHAVRHWMNRSKIFRRSSWQKLRSRSLAGRSASVQDPPSTQNLNRPSKEANVLARSSSMELGQSKSSRSEDLNTRRHEAELGDGARHSVVTKMWRGLHIRAVEALRRQQKA